MSNPLVDRRHLDLLLHDMFDAGALCRYPRFAEHSREVFDATIDVALQIAEQKFAPHNRKSDLNEPRMVDGKVELIPEIEDALNAFNEAGFMAIYADAEDGGMQMPFLITSACDALFAAANASTPAYPLLARAAANLQDVARWVRGRRERVNQRRPPEQEAPTGRVVDPSVPMVVASKG